MAKRTKRIPTGLMAALSQLGGPVLVVPGRGACACGPKKASRKKKTTKRKTTKRKATKRKPKKRVRRNRLGQFVRR